MNNYKFKNFVNQVNSLGTLQFRVLKESVEKRVKSKKVANILETPIKEIKCPHCKSSHFIRWGKRNDLQRYKCKSCTKTFNSLTNTPLARLNKKDKWLNYSKCLKEGLTVRKAAIKCNVHRNTAFRWRHRFINNLKFIKSKCLAGIIETNELKLKESFKGAKVINTKLRKDVHIIQCIDRNRNVYDITNKGFDLNTLNNFLTKVYHKDSLLCINRKEIYIEFSKLNNFKYSCSSLIPKKDSIIKTQNIDNYINNLYKWIMNHFRGVATKYLENYVSWFRSLYEFRNGISPLTLLYRSKQVEKYRHQPQKVTSWVL